MPLSKEEQSNLRKYSFGEYGGLLHIDRTIDDKFCIRPARWSGRYVGGKLADGKYLAKLNTEEEAINIMVDFCGYPREFVLTQCIG